MRCPFCGHNDTQVKDSRPAEENAAIRRRRACPECGSRFTTFERVQLRELTVLKSNGQRVPFDRDNPVDLQCLGEIAIGVMAPSLQCSWVAPPEGDPWPTKNKVLSSPLVINTPYDAGASPASRPSLIRALRPSTGRRLRPRQTPRRSRIETLRLS